MTGWRVCLPLHFFLPRVRFLVNALRIPLLLSIGFHFTVLLLLTSAIPFVGLGRNVIGACPCLLQLGTIKWHSCTLSPSAGSGEGTSFLLLYSETRNYCKSLLKRSAEHPLQATSSSSSSCVATSKTYDGVAIGKTQSHQVDFKNKIIWIWKSKTHDLCQNTLLSDYKHACSFNPHSTQAFILPCCDYQSSVYRFRLNELVLGWSVEVLQTQPKPQKRSVNTTKMIHSWVTNCQVAELFQPGHNCWGHASSAWEMSGRKHPQVPRFPIWQSQSFVLLQA